MIDVLCWQKIVEVLSMVQQVRRPNGQPQDDIGDVHLILFGDLVEFIAVFMELALSAWTRLPHRTCNGPIFPDEAISNNCLHAHRDLLSFVFQQFMDSLTSRC